MVLYPPSDDAFSLKQSSSTSVKFDLNSNLWYNLLRQAGNFDSFLI